MMGAIIWATVSFAGVALFAFGYEKGRRDQALVDDAVFEQLFGDKQEVKS